MTRSLDVKNYFDPFYTTVHAITRLRRDQLALLLPYFEVVSFTRKSLLLQDGEVENYLSLVLRGMVRKYVQLKNQGEVTLQLATEGHFIQSDISFNFRRPSEVLLEALEPCIVVRLHYNKMEEMMVRHPWMEEVGRILAGAMAEKRDARIYNLLKQTPRERFIAYMQKHPTMLQRVPQKILASYLNIQPETFSRLKHLMRKRSGDEDPTHSPQAQVW
ncbi:MAG: Crp/Fnr family transcriptional regulator [Candidatus Pseudobacter hemicellulosilyticus]|uniref:Crp/Fnr family transcriptional regulator n=1 Tax=Candidatus Pseudobacter hemicellulosilyticus TaxID=3121375 RepID=A0AAJ5WXP0_9BACT|nr:MAG: Crp/Fnr family transcriptional regulator [Pseudobacter sp.]